MLPMLTVLRDVTISGAVLLAIVFISIAVAAWVREGKP